MQITAHGKFIPINCMRAVPNVFARIMDKYKYLNNLTTCNSSKPSYCKACLMCTTCTQTHIKNFQKQTVVLFYTTESFLHFFLLFFLYKSLRQLSTIRTFCCTLEGYRAQDKQNKPNHLHLNILSSAAKKPTRSEGGTTSISFVAKFLVTHNI